MNDIDRAALARGWNRWRHIIEVIAPECTAEIAAIAFVESTWRERAKKYEHGFMDLYLLAENEHGKAARRTMDKSGQAWEGFATSWGLMQVMGIVAFERGFEGTLEDLFIGEMSLLYGTLHFQHKWKRYGDVESAISAYNAGTPVQIDSGEFENQKYVDDVLEAREEMFKIMNERR